MSFLKDIAGHPEYMRMLEQAKSMRPELPAWDAKNDNTDEWKEKSAMQQGFDLCLTVFSPK